MKTKTFLLIAGGAALAPATALAHTGAGAAHGFTAGFAHPWLGADHLLAMVLIGVWAGMQGRAAMIAVPAAFLATMAAGALIGVAGWYLPAAELAIAISIIALGGLIATRIRMLPLAGAAVAGLFAFAHGHAHGAEMPLAADGLAYGAGFLLATAVLHGMGIVLGLSARTSSAQMWLRTGGAAAACVGAVFLIGL